MRRLRWLIERPIAHRGLHDAKRGIVENTASAFTASIECGYAIECDLQLAADGEAMVFHDQALGRLTDAQGPVIARSSAELSQLTLRGTADRMQRLEDLLLQVRGQVPLVIELKSRWDGSTAIARRAVEVLLSYAGPFALMSFDPDLVAEVAELDGAIPRGIVADRVIHPEYRALPFDLRMELRTCGHLARSRPHFIAYHAAGLPYGPPCAFRQLGLPVICWTIRSEAEASRARRYADQITFEGFLP